MWLWGAERVGMRVREVRGESREGIGGGRSVG